MTHAQLAFGTDTYDFDSKILREFGQAAEASKSDEDSEMSQILLTNVRASLKSAAHWLHDNPSMMEAYVYLAQQSASVRTHPRHIMDASRLEASDKIFKESISVLTDSFNAELQLEVSDELRDLAKQALQRIELDKKCNDNDIKLWAEQLAADCFGKHD